MIFNKKLVQIIKLVIYIFSLIYFVYFLFENSDLFINLKNMNILSIFVVLLLKGLNIIFLSNINLNILQKLNIKLSNLQSLDLTIKNTLGNLTSPLKLGSGYKISYLKEKYDLKILDYIIWNTFYAYINIFPVLFIFLIYSLIVNKFEIENIILLIVILLIVLYLSIKYFNFRYLLRKNTYYKVTFLYFSKINLVIQLNNILFFISNSVICYLLLNSLNKDTIFFSALSYSFLASIVSLINVTPGNIGVKEVLIISLNQIHGIGYKFIIITSFIERLASFICLFLFQILLKAKRNNN
mgnify:CR=1 FL=1